jgi:hypothetical protein
MSRKVSMSESLAHRLLDLRRSAIEEGLRSEFRIAWRKIWDALNFRPLPPVDAPDTFGELRFTTRNEPRHRVCIGCVRPLSVWFAVHEYLDSKSGEVTTLVTILRADPMWE